MHCARSGSQGFSWFRSCWPVPCLDHAGFGLRVSAGFAVLRAMHSATEVKTVVGDTCKADAWTELIGWRR